MRSLGIIALFGLTLCAIGEGAMLVRLSRRVETMGHRLEAVGASPEEVTAPAPRPPATPLVPGQTRAVLPAARPPEFRPAPEASGRPSTLQELATPEGRQLLRSALDIINEERRQERVTAGVARREEREQRWSERVAKNVALTPDESARLATMVADLKAGRQQILEEMHAGAKTAEQAGDALETLRDNAEKSARALLGEERWKKSREGRDRDRQPQQAQADPPPPR